MPRVNAGDYSLDDYAEMLKQKRVSDVATEPPGRKRVKSEPGVYDMGKGKRKAVHVFGRGSGGDTEARFLSEMQKYADKVLSSGAHDKGISDAAEKHERLLKSIEQWQHRPHLGGQSSANSQGEAGRSYPPTMRFSRSTSGPHAESARSIHTVVRNDRGEEPSRGKAEVPSVPCEVVSNVQAIMSDLRSIQIVIQDNRCRQNLAGNDFQLLQQQMKGIRAIIHGHAHYCYKIGALHHHSKSRRQDFDFIMSTEDKIQSLLVDLKAKQDSFVDL